MKPDKEAVYELLEKLFGSEPKVQPEKEVSSIKSVENELKQATFLAMMAFRDDSEYDLHEDTFTPDEVRKACHNFNLHCMKTNLGHIVMVDDGVARIAESYTTPVDIILGDTYIPKGSWLQVWQFANDKIWEGVKSGYWNGISPAFLAKYIELGDNNDEEG